jgi:hypothetical protein
VTGPAWISVPDAARHYEIGDLVRSASPTKYDTTGRLKKGIGIVVGSDDQHSTGSYRVQWAGDYGTFWATWVQLELISASR